MRKKKLDEKSQCDCTLRPLIIKLILTALDLEHVVTIQIINFKILFIIDYVQTI